MKSFISVLFSGVLLLLVFEGNTVSAWNRYSRNLLLNGGSDAVGGDVGGGSVASAAVGGGIGFNDMNALFNMVNDDGNRIAGNIDGIGQQTEVYGVVEPLIEDMPCVDRQCNVNDDCCPTGVCVNTYGEGKCVYVYGRKRDYCHWNIDCDPGMACVKSAAGNMVCQPTLSRVMNIDTRRYEEECESSGDCNVAKGMCCQYQHSHHHRLLPRKLCAYFNDPFKCIDIMPHEN